ncbi:MAG: helix-turn-helix transcriptional regulator [Bacteroidetes bacterium]|nr:helix-turn-helix transcriptional regulator [Bacteroidota bacterium]
MKMHIGKKIKEAVKRSGMSVTEFAAKINYSRRNIYSIFEKESVDTSLLTKISDVLGQDFFVHYSSDSKKYAAQHGRVEEPSGASEYSENRIRELLKEVEYLKEINSLLKIQIEKLSKRKESKK